LALAAVKHVEEIDPRRKEIKIEDDPWEIDHTCEDTDEWDTVIAVLENAVLWDADYEDFSAYADLPPAESLKLKERLSVDPDYFGAIAPDPRPSSVPDILRRIDQLLDQRPS